MGLWNDIKELVNPNSEVRWYHGWGAGDANLRADWMREKAQAHQASAKGYVALAKSEVGLASAKAELHNAKAILNQHTYTGWVKTRPAAMWNKTIKSIKGVGLVGAIAAGAGALMLMSRSDTKANRFRAGDENLGDNNPLMTPDMLQPPIPMDMMQPQGRQVLGPMTARVLGAEAPGPNQPGLMDSLDGKTMGTLGRPV